MNMKNLPSFEEFLNEATKPYTLDIEEENWESPELLDWVVSSLGAINTKETIIENRKKQITTRNKTYNLKFEN